MRLRLKALGLTVDNDDDDDDDDDDDRTALPRLTHFNMRFRAWGLALPVNMFITYNLLMNTLVNCVDDSKKDKRINNISFFHPHRPKKKKVSMFRCGNCNQHFFNLALL